MSDILEVCREGGEWINGHWCPFSDQDRRDAAKEIERLRAALKPFAAYHKQIEFRGFVPGALVRATDVRRACEALESINASHEQKP